MSWTLERLGGTKTIRVNVELVAATNRHQVTMVQGGRFRNDLYYRLDVVAVVLPLLRQHKGDIPRLVGHFTQKLARRMGGRIESIPAEAMDGLVDCKPSQKLAVMSTLALFHGVSRPSPCRWLKDQNAELGRFSAARIDLARNHGLAECKPLG